MAHCEWHTEKGMRGMRGVLLLMRGMRGVLLLMRGMRGVLLLMRGVRGVLLLSTEAMPSHRWGVSWYRANIENTEYFWTLLQNDDSNDSQTMAEDTSTS